MIRSKTDLEDGIQIQPSLPASPELSPRSCSPVNEEISDEKAIRAPPVPVTPTVPSEEVPDIPDGGWRAWVVVFGAFLAFFSSFGVIYSYGTFQSYYESSRLSQQSESLIALIGAIQLFCLYGFGPLVGKLFDAHGLRVLLPLGSFLTVLALFMLSLAKPDQTYQYFLFQGVMFGLGNAMIFTPTTAVLTHWFRRRRALALGIVSAGSSLGGVIFPIVLHRLFPRIGFGWTVRVAAFIVLGCLTVSNACIRTRLPPKPTTTKEILCFIDVGGFRDPRFCLVTAGAFCIFYTSFNPYFYIEQYAEYLGVDPKVTPYLVSIVNAFGIPARLIPGLLADKCGALNIIMPTTLVSSVLVLAVWLPSRGLAAIIAFLAFYALTCGAVISLLPAYIAKISPQQKYGARLGSVYALTAIANLVGTPTAGAFVKTSTQAHFDHLIGFSGALILIGGVLFTIVRTLETLRARKEARDNGEFIEDYRSTKGLLIKA